MAKEREGCRSADHGRYCKKGRRHKGDGVQSAKRRARHQREPAQDHPGHGGHPRLHPGAAGRGAHPRHLHRAHGLRQIRGFRHRHHHRLPSDGRAHGLQRAGGPPDRRDTEVRPLRRLYAAGGLYRGAVSGPDPARPVDEGLYPQPHPGGAVRQPHPGQPHRLHPSGATPPSPPSASTTTRPSARPSRRCTPWATAASAI